MNFRSTLHLLLFAFTSSSSAKLYVYEVEVDNNVNVRSLKGAGAAAAAAAAAADEEHRNLKKAAKKSGQALAASASAGAGLGQVGSVSVAFDAVAVAEQASTFITAFEIFEAAAELAAKLEQACCVSCNQGTSTSNICAGLFELECASPIAQVIGDCLEKLCTCEFRQCALERLVTELCDKPELVPVVGLMVYGLGDK